MKANRRQLDIDLRDSPKRRFVSPVLFGLYHEVVPRIRSHATGRALDAGCGTMPFRRYFKNLVTHYNSVDIEARAPEVTFLGDIQFLDGIPDDTYDTILCSEVLEHVPNAALAVSELHRVMRPGGKIIVTVPFLSRLHEEPFDYQRFTKHGLRVLLEEAHFKLIEIVPTGSLFSFLGHQLSTILIATSYKVPVLRHVLFWVNALLITLPCHWVDRLSRVAEKLPVGYVAVAEKTSDSKNRGMAG